MENKQTVYTKLAKVQQELKAPKTQFNKFGNYNYRNQEDILEAVKPLLAKHGLILTLEDNIILIGNRFYVKADAYLMNLDEGREGDTVNTTAYAREVETKSGMDASQITGAASSYARKYALNGLFLIDDTKDSDFTNGLPTPEAKPVIKPATPTVTTGNNVPTTALS